MYNIEQEKQYNYKILRNDSTPIKYIYHMADIHIKNSDTFTKEYIHVFTQLFNYLKNQSLKENSIIVICGDIMHNKCLYSNFALELFNQFMDSLSEIMPVVAILGNHDGSLVQKIDGIKCIISRIPKIYYLDYSGEYVYNNIVFGVSSLLDGKIIKASSLKTKFKTTIALYHGKLSGAVYDTNMKITCNINNSTFAGYDYVLLGDIHKPQYLNKERTIAYPSSLIQQNFGESIMDHGLIKWDILDKTSQFIPIFNDYCYLQLTIDNGQLLTELPQFIPKYPRIKIISYDTSKLDCYKLSQELFPQFTSFYVDHRSKKSNELQLKIPETIADNIDIQINLIKQFYNENLKMNDETKLNQLISVHKQAAEQVNYKKYQPTSWKLLNLKFSNMFSFGENNEIDFKNFNGTINIDGENHMGKSSCIDIILYAIYEKCSRCNHLSILNHNKTNMISIITLEVNGKVYKITRNYDAKISKNKIELYLHVINEKNEYINLTEKDKPITEKKIEELFGKYDNIIATNFYLQKEVEFIYLSGGHQFDILSEQCGIKIISKLKKLVLTLKNNTMKEIMILMKEVEDFDKKNQKKERYMIEERKKFEVELEQKKNILESLENDIEQCYNSKKNITNDDINDIMNELVDLLKIKNNITIEDLISYVDNYIIKYDNIQKKYEIDYNKKSNIIANLEKELKNIDSEIKKYKEYDKSIIDIEIRYLSLFLDTLEKIIESNECTECNINTKLSEYYNSYELLKEKKEKTLLKSSNKSLKDLLLTSNDMKQKLDKEKNELTETKYENEKTKLQYSVVKSNYQQLINFLDLMNEDENINKNINTLKDKKNIIEKEIEKLKSKLTQIIIDVNSEIKMNDYIDIKKETIKKLEKEYEIYDLYVKIMSAEGLFLMMLNPFVCALENKMNEILKSLTYFKVTIEHRLNSNGKGKKKNKKDESKHGGNMTIYLVDDNGKKLDVRQLSGSESFIMSFAFKLGLSYVSKCSKPDFFTLDEAFSSLGEEYTLNSLPKMLDMLESNYKFSLVIDHNKYVKMSCKDEIIITKNKNGFSKIYNINENVHEIIKQEIEDESKKIIPLYIFIEEEKQKIKEEKIKKIKEINYLLESDPILTDPKYDNIKIIVGGRKRKK